MERQPILHGGSTRSSPRRGGRSAGFAKPEIDGIAIDRYRAIVFPNRIREFRKRTGVPKLLELAAKIPDISYIRLSKIERGEVFAKPAELLVIANALGVKVEDLLIDVDSDDFDIETWAADLQDWVAIDLEEDRFSVLLAAAIKMRRERDNSLTIAAIERDYGIAPVILSRLENAFKPFSRWNESTINSLCQLFELPDAMALRAHVLMLHAEGALDQALPTIANPSLRVAKTKARVAALREELQILSDKPAAPSPGADGGEDSPRLSASDRPPTLPVYGMALPHGLIAFTETPDHVDAPRIAGPRSYGLKVCRPTLGPALPGRATVVVDPDLFPSAGSIAVVKEKGGLRLLMIAFARSGEMIGFSAHPEMEISLDDVDPANIATVISAVFE